MKQERWLTAAVSDDSLVAELLLRLKDSATPDSSVGKISVLPAWGVRQPRSSAEKKKRDARRRSPTTPLSWSAASPSDCYDDSSADRPQPFDLSRSKELATLRFTVVDQISMDNSLKRRKLDFPLESGTNTKENSEHNDLYMNESGTSEATSKSASRHVKQEETSKKPKPSEQRVMAFQEPVFVLPDLNMSPEEGIVGMS